MTKKILLLLILLLLSSCGSKEEEKDDIPDTASDFIEPVNDIEVFSFLEKDMYERLYRANGDEEVDTYILEYLGNELIDYELTDINGKTVDLNS